jgi:NADH-quinone oxidoreductase subunit M
MVYFTMASLGLPGLNGFIGEFLCLMGCFTAEPSSVAGFPGLLGPWYAVVAGLGLVLAAMYLLIMLGKLVWGPLKEPNGRGHGHGHDHGHDRAGGELPADLSAREIGILVPLAVVCLAIGFYPKPMLEAIAPSVESTLKPYPKLVLEYADRGTLLPTAATPAVGTPSSPTVSPAALRSTP